MTNAKWSVVVPTYNRLPILKKCLAALENQQFDEPYEVLVVDDGSTDDTISYLQSHAADYPHLRLLQQEHKAAAAARNLGIQEAKGDYIVFVDSDIIVVPDYLAGHAATLATNDRAFTYGRIINTSNFDDPTAEVSHVVFFPGAFFDTCNAAIARHWLLEAGLFDTDFSQYGWEDLELGLRLKKLGLVRLTCAQALGYHWHGPFNLSQLPRILNMEDQRIRMGILFYQKHPTWEVRMMIQMTWLHYALWGLLTLGGVVNDRTMRPLLQWLIERGKPDFAMEVLRIFLNWYSVKGMYAAHRETQRSLQS